MASTACSYRTEAELEKAFFLYQMGKESFRIKFVYLFHIIPWPLIIYIVSVDLLISISTKTSVNIPSIDQSGVLMTITTS